MSGKEMKKILESLEKINEFNEYFRNKALVKPIEMKDSKFYDDVVNDFTTAVTWNPSTSRYKLIVELANKYKIHPKELKQELDNRGLTDYLPPSRDFNESKSFKAVLREIQKKG